VAIMVMSLNNKLLTNVVINEVINIKANTGQIFFILG
jgi:hypothetical protein